MAKSFKQPVVKAEAAKPASEKDFLSFLEEEREEVTVSAPVSEEKGKPSEQAVTNSTDVTSVTDIVLKNEEGKATIAENQDADVRQTFIIGKHYLEQLKNYVHTRRIAGEYEYTQKQALQEALDKLFAGFDLVSRPAHIRQQEENRKQKIRRGKGA